MSRVESLANHLAPPPVRALFHPAGAKLQPRYDIIVVGAGSAGCALAADLAARLPKASVLLIEAGGTNQMFRVASPFITCPDLQNSELDWAYRTTPQPLQQNRPSFWPRGKTLGGSSSINFMLAVRGCPNGYEEWAEKHGCGPEWGFAACERFFRQLEDYTGSRHLPRRGKQGKLKIRDCRDDPNVPTRPVCEAFLQGCAAEGVPVSEDYNAPHAHAGCGLSQTTIFPNGYRCDTASAFLFGEAGALHTCKNLSVLCDAQVARLVMSEGPRCTGVEFCGGGAVSAREVVLSAGAVGSPHILLLSGIGPKAHLQSKGVKVHKDLPGVGRGLKDHLMVALVWGFRPDVTEGSFFDKSPMEVLRPLARHLVFGDGLFSSSWVQAMCFFKSTLATKSQANDIQVHFIPMNPKNTEQTKRNMGFDPDKFVQMDGSLGPDRGVTFLPSLLQPKSEGFIELNSSNPLDHPIIEPNYLAHPDDVEVMCQAFEFCRRAGKTPAMQRLLNPEETYDTSIQHDPNSREYVKAKVQRDLITIYHPTSTCKMGPASNPLAVLDPASLRVRGVAGLRVVDCASMPDVPAANTNLPAIMLALRAGELIAQSWVQ